MATFPRWSVGTIAETKSIIIAKKYGLSAITAKYDVVESIGQVYAKFTYHCD